jgi:hypothetical protein
MPVVYVSAAFNITVDLATIEGAEYLLEQWTDDSIAAQRAEYGNSNLFFSIEADNAEDPDATFLINPEKEQLYAGDFTMNRLNKTFTFNCHGQFKANAHKLVKAAVDRGVPFRLSAVMINGAAYPIEEASTARIQVSSKKL